MSPPAAPTDLGGRGLAQLVRSVYRPIEVLNRCTRRMHGERARPRTRGVQNGFRPRTRCVSVIRKLFRGDVGSMLVELLESSEHLGVHGAPLPAEQVGVDRLTCQGVSKREPVVRILDDELRSDELLQNREQLAFLEREKCLEECKVETPPGDGRQLDCLSGRPVEAVDAALDRIVHRPGNA